MMTNSSNPFATRFTRPGAIAYLFPEGESGEHLVERLRSSAWQGEIVGPHGAGKSTLVATLLPLLREAEREIVHVALRAGESALPEALNDWRNWNAKTLVVVDGYEQLSLWSRHRLMARVRRQGAGLLITTHTPSGLPLLMRAVPLYEAAERVVRQLVPDEQLIGHDDIQQSFRDCDGNIREMLFRLYDLYESRTR